jgi:hypothetical protein
MAMFESVRTRATIDFRLGDPGNFDNRKQAYGLAKMEKGSAKELEYLRNALAHGQRPMDSREANNLRDRQQLSAALRRLADDLLNP